MTPIAETEENLAEADMRDGRTSERKAGWRDSILGFGGTDQGTGKYKRQGGVFRARSTVGVYFILAKDARHAHEIATGLGYKITEMFACPEHIMPNFDGLTMIQA